MEVGTALTERAGRQYCGLCARQIDLQNSQKSQDTKGLFQGPAPREIFTVIRAAGKGPGDRGRRIPLGAVIFLDKGICFARFGEYSKPSMLWLLLVFLGFLPMIIAMLLAGSAAKDKKQKVFRDAEMCIGPEANLDALLNVALGAVFIPWQDVTSMSFNATGMEVCQGTGKYRFAWDGGGKVSEGFRPLLQACSAAVQGRQGVYAACQPAISQLKARPVFVPPWSSLAQPAFPPDPNIKW